MSLRIRIEPDGPKNFTYSFQDLVQKKDGTQVWAWKPSKSYFSVKHIHWFILNVAQRILDRPDFALGADIGSKEDIAKLAKSLDIKLKQAMFEARDAVLLSLHKDLTQEERDAFIATLENQND